ncbi:MAG: hypothetical protein KGY70_16550, partial [Bacteroidales bacterium]|nr:hypothetical protein [Bacteroidales bacterium]
MKFTKGYMLLLFFLATFNALPQEGTKQLMPSSTDRLYLMLNHNDHPDFAMYGCDEDVRLNIYLKAGEKLYFGMQLNAKHHFRIKEEDGGIIFEEQATPDSGDAGYIADYNEAVSGPEGVKLNGNTISESEGYTPLSFTAQETGNHYIEFDYSNTKTHIHFIDFTVTDADDNIITNPTNPNQSAGRLWSENWVMTTTSFDEYPVNTYFYVFTGDEFVNKVKFDMKPYGFDFVSNSNGLPTGSNHALKKAQSKDGKITISNGYKIFLNDPDQSVFKNTKLPPPEAKVWIENDQIYDYDYTRDPQLLNFNQDTVTIEKNGDPDCAEDDLMLFKIQSNIDGFTRIYLDIDGNGFSDNSTQDTLLQKEIFEGTNYITWDFKDKAGNEVADGTYSASATFLGRGPAHFPLYDVETLSNVEALSIRPFNKLGPTLYWDDTPVDNAGQWGDNTGNMDNTQVNQLQNGASVPRIWTYENGFDNGDENSMNTWFNAIDLGMKTIDLKVASTDTCKEGDAPIVADTYKDTTVNTTVDFTAYDFERKFSDPADQILDKIKVLSLPDNGTLNLNGSAVSVNDEISQDNLANLTFDPDTDWTGETSFKWEASNGTAYSRNTDFVYITINTPPTIENIDNQYVCADQKLSDLSFTIGDAETDASELQLRAYSHNLNLVENSNISFGGSGQNRTISVTPNAGVTGSAIIYIEVSDGHSSTIGDFNLFIGPDLTFQGDTTLCTGSDLSITA